MIGLIFNTLEKVVVEEFGEDAWDDLLEQTDSEGIYHGLGSYDDNEVVELVVAAGKMLEKDPFDILRWFGQKAAHQFQIKLPEMFSQFDNFFEYMLSLNDIIHPHVKQLYPNSQVPYFKTIKHTENDLVLEYISGRQMCHLAEGLILGSAEIFKTPISITQTQCVHQGAKNCHIKIKLEE